MWLSQFPCSFYLPVTMYRELTGSCLELTGLYPELTASTCAVFPLLLILSLTFRGDIRSAFGKAMETKRKYVTRSRRWQMADGRWQMADGRLQIARRSQIANRRSQIADRPQRTQVLLCVPRAARTAQHAALTDFRAAICNRGSAGKDLRCAIGDRRSAIGGLRSLICDLGCAICNLRSRSYGL